MTFSMTEIDPFDVLIARVEFEDRPGVAKPRPVIAVNIDDEHFSVVAVKVTSHAPRPWCPGEVVLVDWEREGLAKPSVARCSKLLLLEAQDIRARVGMLTERDRVEILRWL